MADYQDTGSRERPTAYTVTGADLIVCPECGVPEKVDCRDTRGIAKKWPHQSRWRR